MTKCKPDCFYYCKSTDSCDFYLITGERRGCSYNNCTRYLKKHRDRTALQDYNMKKTAQWSEKFTRMRTLYEEGKYDNDIAEMIGCHVLTVKRWRNREGLISQTARQKLNDMRIHNGADGEKSEKEERSTDIS